LDPTGCCYPRMSDAMGPDPIGYIAYHADGRMMALVLKRDRPTLMGAAPTDEERVRLFDHGRLFRDLHR
jgi:Lipocalin-like domain